MLKAIIDIFTQGAGQRIGQMVTFGAIAATLAPLGLWVWGHRTDEITCISLGDLITGGLISAPVLLVVYFTSARRNPPPRNPFDR